MDMNSILAAIAGIIATAWGAMAAGQKTGIIKKPVNPLETGIVDNQERLVTVVQKLSIQLAHVDEKLNKALRYSETLPVLSEKVNNLERGIARIESNQHITLSSLQKASNG